MLRRNVIENNTEDGVVVTVDALPDLGTNANPGGNKISNNTGYDLNNATKTNKILAIGNEIDPTRIQGSVDVGDRNTNPSGPQSR